MTTILNTSTSSSNQTGLAAAVEDTIRAETTALDVVEISPTPPMQLSDLQFAVGCVGESETCLRQVTEQLEVEALLLSSVERAGDAVVLEAALFRARTGTTKRATRRVSGPDAESAVLDEVPGLLRELLGLPAASPKPQVAPPPSPEDTATETNAPTQPEPPPAPGAHQPEPSPPRETNRPEMQPTQKDMARTVETSAEPTDARADDDDFPVLAVVVAGAGLVTAGTGAVFGMLARGSEEDFTSSPATTPAEIDAAYENLDTAQSQATTANALFAIGGALVVTGGALYFLMQDDDRRTETLSLSPFVGRTGGGVHVEGHFGGAP